MKIVATADLHGKLPQIPECDVLIIAGDVCPYWDHSLLYQRCWLENTFSEWLREQPAALIIGIGGNHDFALERSPWFAKELPWNYLLDEGIIFDGVKFWGSPWVPNLSSWAFHGTDDQLDDKFAAVPDDTDILIVHGPPHMHSDWTCPKYGNMPVGFPGMLPVLDRVNPDLYICGHIHEAYGYSIYKDTLICNVSHMTENYEPSNQPVVIMYELPPLHGMYAYAHRELEASNGTVYFPRSPQHYAVP